MQIQVNGERRELKDESRMSDLLNALSLAPERVAVELNHQIVRRNEWPNTILKDGDRIEIVHFVGGGMRRKAEGRKQKAVVVD
jgi:thiamine biosynthesis protein ThiS